MHSETRRAGARPCLLRFCLVKLLGSDFRRHLVIKQEARSNQNDFAWIAWMDGYLVLNLLSLNEDE